MASRSRQQPKGEMAPAQFVSCLLRVGIAPEGVDIPSETSATTTAAAAAASSLAPTTTDSTRSRQAAAARSSTANESCGTIRCTDGAIDALRRCHSEFLSLIAAEVATISSNDANNSKKKGGKKRPRDVPSATDQADDTTSGVAAAVDASLSKVISEADVMTCLHRLGMDRIATEGRNNINQWEAKKRASDEEMHTTTSSSSNRSRKKKTKKLKRGFDDKDVTADLIAEQERLLAESARAMKERMAKQREG